MATVLTIDDDDTILSMVEAILEKAGHTSVCASGGQQGLEIVQDNQPDAILLDRKMPQMDGNQVLIELKADEKTCDIPVIMLTGDSGINDVSACLELGAIDYIVKPFNHDNFLTRLDRVLDKDE